MFVRFRAQPWPAVALGAAVVGTAALTAALTLAGCSPGAKSESQDGPSPVTGAVAPQRTAEEEVLALFKGDQTPDADARRIIARLPDLDWSLFSKMNTGKSGDWNMALLEWLDRRQIDDVTEITNVLKGTEGLDGAYTERYSSLVGTLLSVDPVKFLHAMSALPAEQAERITSFVGFHSTESNMAATKEELRRLRTSPDLTATERDRAGVLIRAMETPLPSAASTEEGEMLRTLRQMLVEATFPVLLPTEVPDGLHPGRPWRSSESSPIIHVPYLTEGGKDGLLVANGPSGSGLDKVPGKTGKSVQVRENIAAHLLINQPEFGGPILWWNENSAYVAISGPNLTEEDLIRIANSMWPAYWPE